MCNNFMRSEIVKLNVDHSIMDKRFSFESTLITRHHNLHLEYIAVIFKCYLQIAVSQKVKHGKKHNCVCTVCTHEIRYNKSLAAYSWLYNV